MEAVFQLGGGSTWINFMATIGQAYSAHPRERIPDPSALAAWLDAVELSPQRAATLADVADAHALRAALRELALGHVDQRPPDSFALAELSRHLPAMVPAVEPSRDGVYLSRPINCREALSRIALQAAMHLAGPEREQLRACDEHDCRWVFADPTGRRRWCPAPTCANRGRVRAYRARQQTG
jgi:predicted RNA-binding Zn ribbon-like protein